MQSETTPVADHAATTPTAVPAVHVNALNTAETEEAVESAGVSKTKQSKSVTFILALFAGAFIALGGSFFTVVMSDASLGFALQRVIGGLVFCLGLVLVLLCGAELFTGNSLMICALASRKIDVKGLLRNWGLVWIGNFVGALLVVALIFLIGISAAFIYPLTIGLIEANYVSLFALCIVMRDYFGTVSV
ncbi:formate/nitrite transporter family protein, partial [uncultured Bifidobacterium sp.]|uniref:formate/nitrite transporter family protein n=1 Tax=uncultured Bifidobacterium sp. TaxID=165187 RepID=UPI002596D3F9